MDARAILIMGNSGSGKSTLARALAERRGLAHLDLDTIAYAEPAVRDTLDASLAKLRAFASEHASSGWVAEGCYGDLVEAALASCDLLVFLDPGLERCLAHNQARPWEPHKYGSKADQDANLAMLQSWVRSYYERSDACSLAVHRRVFEAFDGPKQRVVDGAAWLREQAPSDTA